MATKPFKSRLGFSDGSRVIVSGIGLPASAGNNVDLIAAANAGGIGSTWTDNTGQTYVKHTAGAGAANWDKLVRTADLASLSGGSWREPALVGNDTTLTTAAIITSMNAADTLDGVTVVAGSRLLLAGLTTNPNVYIVGGTTGAWSLTEDANAATAGDVVRITQGSLAGQAWQFDSAGAWGYVDSQTNAEDSFIRAFIGKSAAGNELPAYINTNYVTTGTSLEAAISALDGALNTTDAGLLAAEANITANQNKLTNIYAAVGLDAAGALNAFVGTTYLGAVSTVHAGLVALDSALNTLSTQHAADKTAMQAELDATQAGAGLAAGGAYVAAVGANYIAAAVSLADADDLLDAALNTLATQVAGLSTSIGNTSAYTSTTTVIQGSSLVAAVSALDAKLDSLHTTGSANAIQSVILDTVLVDEFDFVEWNIVAASTATKSDKFAMKLMAIHNGTPTSDATSVDDTDGFDLGVGTEPDVSFDVALTGVGAAQVMQLIVTATANVDVKFTRSAT